MFFGTQKYTLIIIGHANSPKKLEESWFSSLCKTRWGQKKITLKWHHVVSYLIYLWRIFLYLFTSSWGVSLLVASSKELPHERTRWSQQEPVARPICDVSPCSWLSPARGWIFSLNATCRPTCMQLLANSGGLSFFCKLQREVTAGVVLNPQCGGVFRGFIIAGIVQTNVMPRVEFCSPRMHRLLHVFP